MGEKKARRDTGSKVGAAIVSVERRRMMGELKARYCVESCEVPKKRSAAQQQQQQLCGARS